MTPRSIKIIQQSRDTGRERRAELCWRYLCFISTWTSGKKSPEAVLDAMLWGDAVETPRFTYRLAS